jgi:hypothetical protein
VSDGFGTKGTVLKDFLSGASVMDGAAALTIAELNTTHINAAIEKNRIR